VAMPGAPGELRVNKFETSLGMRSDVEATLTYVIGCLTGIVFLIIEQKNDYVRFHAWQSCMVFFTMMVIHLIFVWQPVVSYILMAIDFLLIGLLGFMAYSKGDTLERFKVPIYGNLAAKWVDTE